MDLFTDQVEAGVRGWYGAPRATIEKFHELLGVFLRQAWGMTEASPLVTVGAPLAKHDIATRDEVVQMQTKQGRQIYGVELKLSGPDGESYRMTEKQWVS